MSAKSTSADKAKAAKTPASGKAPADKAKAAKTPASGKAPAAKSAKAPKEKKVAAKPAAKAPKAPKEKKAAAKAPKALKEKKAPANKAPKGKINNPAIKRVARVAGVDSIANAVYDEARVIIHQQLEKLLRNTVTIMKYLRSKTVGVNHVVAALGFQGVHFVASVDKLKSMPDPKAVKGAKAHQPEVGEAAHKSRRAKPGSAARREVTRAQKNSYLLSMHISPFKTLVREIAKEFNDGEYVRFSRDAILAIQLALETYLVSLFEKAVVITHNSKRTKLMPKDIQLTLYVLGDRTALKQ